MDACLQELQRNPALRLLVGIEAEEDVPKPHNMSRFAATLGEEAHLSLLRAVFDALVQRLGAVVVDLGKDTAGDSTALAGRAADSKRLRQEGRHRLLLRPRQRYARASPHGLHRA